MATTVVNIHQGHPYEIYVGRHLGPQGIWGNPWSHLPGDGTRAAFQVATREEAIAKYEEWIQTQPELMAKLIRLKGKVLGCWCKPKLCHGDILARMADALPDPPDLVGDFDLGDAK